MNLLSSVNHMSEPTKQHVCVHLDCSNKLDPNPNDQLQNLAMVVFGPLARQALNGYCSSCKKQNLSRIWLLLVYLISLAIFFIELPWKGPLAAITIAFFWTAVLWKTAFGRPQVEDERSSE